MIITQKIDKAVAILHEGGVLAYPTEAIFGLGCDPSNQVAIQHLLALKKRSSDKGLILMAANMQQLEPYILPLANDLKQKILATWPGFITWIVPARTHISTSLTGKRRTLAVRVSDYSLCRQLCQKFGSAIVSTSANLSGLTPAITTDEVIQQFPQNLNAILDHPVQGRHCPSEIRDAKTGDILRSGC